MVTSLLMAYFLITLCYNNDSIWQFFTLLASTCLYWHAIASTLGHVIYVSTGYIVLLFECPWEVFSYHRAGCTELTRLRKTLVSPEPKRSRTRLRALPSTTSSHLSRFRVESRLYNNNKHHISHLPYGILSQDQQANSQRKFR